MAVVGTATVLIRAAEIPGQAARIVDRLGRTVSRGLSATGNDSGRGFLNNFFRYLGRRGLIAQMLQNVFAEGIQKVANAFSHLTGIGFLAEQSRGIMDFLTNLDRIMPKFAIMTTGLGGLVGWIGGLVGQIFTMVGDLSTVPALLAPVPGLLMGAVTAAVLLMVALKDAKDELAPLKDEMQALGDTISTGFWAEARQPIIDLVESVFPALNTAMEGSSRALGRWVAAFADGLRNNFDAATIEEIFDAFDEGFDILSEGGDAAAGILRSFALIAADYFPAVAESIRDMTIRFDEWLERIRNDGSLDAWIQDAQKNLTHLWNGLLNFGGVLAGITRAFNAAGFDGLAAFESATARWERTINSPETQNALTNVFIGFRAAFDGVNAAVADIFGGILSQSDNVRLSFESIGATIRLWGDYLGEIFANEGFASGVSDMFADFQTAFENIGPAITPLAEKLGDIAGYIGDMAVAFSGPFAAAIVALEEPFERVLAALTTITETLAPELTRIFESSEFATIVDGIAEAIENFAAMIRDNMPGLRPIIDSVLSIVSTIASQLPGLVSALQPFFDVLQEMAPIIEAIAQAVNFAVILVSTGVRIAATLIGAIVETMVYSIKIFGENIARVGEIIQAGLSGDFSRVGEIMQEMANSSTAFMETVGSNFTTAMEQASVIGAEGALSMISAFGEQMGLDSSMVQSITDNLSGEELAHVQHLLMNEGSDAAMSYVQGLITSSDANVPGAAAGIAASTEAGVSPIVPNLGALGSQSASSLAGALQGGIPQVEGEARSMRESAYRAVSTLASELTEIGQSSGGGLSQGLRDRINEVAAASGGLENASVSELMSLASELQAEGQAGGTGLSLGMRDRIDVVRGAASSLLSNATGAMSGAYGAGAGVGGQLADGMAAGIRSRMAYVRTAAGNLVSNATRAAQNAAEVRSPSRLWRRELGAQMAAGAALGIGDGANLVERAARNAIPAISLPITSDIRLSRGAAVTSGAGGTMPLTPTQVNIQVDVQIEGGDRDPRDQARELVGHIREMLSTDMRLGVMRR